MQGCDRLMVIWPIGIERCFENIFLNLENFSEIGSLCPTMAGEECDGLMTIRHWDVLVAFQLLHLHSGSSTLPTTVILHNHHNLSASLPLAICIFNKKKKQISENQFPTSRLCLLPCAIKLLAVSTEESQRNLQVFDFSYAMVGVWLARPIGQDPGFSCRYICAHSLFHRLWQADKQTPIYYKWKCSWSAWSTDKQTTRQLSYSMELKIFVTQRGSQSTEVRLECMPKDKKRHTFWLLTGNDKKMSCHQCRAPTDLHDFKNHMPPMRGPNILTKIWKLVCSWESDLFSLQTLFVIHGGSQLTF